MIKSLTKFYELPLFILLVCLLGVLCVSGNFSAAVTDGIALWFACVLPALLPYLFITAILSSLSVTDVIFLKFSPVTKRLFNVGGSVGYAFLLSVFSGYPVGAKTVSDLKISGAIGETESVRAAALCSTSSPVFLISTVGGLMFSNKAFGVALFAIHLISATLVGVIFSFYKRADKPAQNQRISSKSHGNILYDSAYSSVVSVLVVGALITVFYLLTEVLTYYKILTPLTGFFELLTGNESVADGLASGLFECTKGLKIMSATGVSALPYAAAVCSFGGLSVIMQSVSFLKRAKIKTAPFIISKIISAVSSLILGFVFLPFLQ